MTMITITHKNLRLNMWHNCSEVSVHPTHPLVNADFLIAASLVIWPDLDPLEITGDEDEEEDNDDPDSQVMHLVVNGEYDNFENSYPLVIMTTPLPSLHTLQLNSIAL